MPAPSSSSYPRSAYLTGLPAPGNFKDINDISQYLSNLYQGLTRWHFKTPTSASETGLPWVTPEQYGAKGDGVHDDTAAIQEAVTACPIGGMVVCTPGKTYLLGSSVTITKAVCVNLNGAIIISPTSGFAFEIRSTHFDTPPILADGASIIGNGSTALWWAPETDTGSIVRLRSGSSGAILNVDSDRVRIQDIGLDLADLTGVFGIHHLGGWYNNYKNILVSRDAGAGTYGLQVESAYSASAPYPEGAAGVFICNYESILCNRVNITGTALMPVTTLNFTGLSCSYIGIKNAFGINFTSPIVQTAAGPFFHIEDATKITCIGGDYEGGGTLYECVGAVSQIYSVNNAIWQNYWPTTPIVYYTGTPTDSLLLDDFGYQSFGSDYTPEDFCIARNIQLTSATAGNLADAAKDASAIILSSDGNVRIKRAASGVSPVTLVDILDAYSSVSAHLTLEGKSGASGNPYVKMIDGRTDGKTWTIKNGATLGAFEIHEAAKGTIFSLTSDTPGVSSYGSLNVVGNSLQLTGGDSVGVKCEDTGGNIAFVQLKSGADSWNIEMSREGAGVFGLLQGGVGTRLVLDTAGNVGIGTTAPAARLDLSSTDIQFVVRYSPTQFFRFYRDGTGGVIQSATTGVGYDQTVINPYGGKVGIGTLSPGSALSVVGLPSYLTDALAGNGGLTTGDLYTVSGTTPLVLAVKI